MIPNWGDFAPQGIPGNAYRYFWLSELREVVGRLMVCNGGSLEMLLNILQRTGRPTPTTNYPAPNVTRLEVEKRPLNRMSGTG